MSETGKKAPGAISSGGTNERVLEILLGFCAERGSAEPLRILELGSGAGHLATLVKGALEERSIPFTYQCTDIEPEQINGQELGFTCRRVDVQEPFELEGPYDAVIAVEIIEHIENPFHFIREIAGVIAPTGLLLLTSPNVLSLSSRARFMFTGCYDYFRRPFDEHHLNMGHLNPVSALLAVYALRKNGFTVRRIACNRWSLGSALPWLPFLPLVYLWTWFHYVFRERGEGQRARNRELIRLVLTADLLFGKIAVFDARRTEDFVASAEGWHRADERFPA